MHVTGPGGYCLAGVEVARTWMQRWRGLMGRSPRPVLLQTSSVHGFWLREPVWLVGLDDRCLVADVRLLSRRRLAWLRGCHWILELPQDTPLPAVGDRLAFHPDDGEADRVAGILYLCATPIGNLGDASPRLADTLAAVDVVYAEDTRRSAALLTALGVSASLRSFFVGNQHRRIADVEADLAAERSVAVITDGGTPSVSDPGVVAVTAARRAGADVVVIPGPSAVTAAVAGSGMVDGPFVFEGFLPRKGSDRARVLRSIAADTRPTVLFVSPHRARDDMADLAAGCGDDREVCVARELTKVHEELWWGPLGEVRDRWRDQGPRGEVTVVVAGATPPAPDPREASRLARELVDSGMSKSEAAREAAAATGVTKRLIYDDLVKGAD